MRNLLALTAIFALACSAKLDGEIVATVNGDAVVFTHINSTGAAPEELTVRCDTGEVTSDGDEVFDDVWAIEGDPLTFPITLGVLPAGATATVAYQAATSGAECGVSARVPKNATTWLSHEDWFDEFVHP